MQHSFFRIFENGRIQLVPPDGNGRFGFGKDPFFQEVPGSQRKLRVRLECALGDFFSYSPAEIWERSKKP
ncbi:hypothetical protein, partial [Leptospira ellisii]|uniref:hypothetical protein n=1 Tax=Leptospira ellisii TaxID=2023197 RepID=UPI000CAB73E2